MFFSAESSEEGASSAFSTVTIPTLPKARSPTTTRGICSGLLKGGRAVGKYSDHDQWVDNPHQLAKSVVTGFWIDPHV
jgi:hypothetical protein